MTLEKMEMTVSTIQWGTDNYDGSIFVEFVDTSQPRISILPELIN